jgi:hypothetical protein
MELASPFKRQLNGGHSRDAKGRFTYGHPGGPGRPRRAVEQDYLHIVSAVCPPDRLAAIVENLVTAAERGDQTAIQLLLKYLVGTASAAPTLTQMAISELANHDPTERAAKALRFQSLAEGHLDAIDL